MHHLRAAPKRCAIGLRYYCLGIVSRLRGCNSRDVPGDSRKKHFCRHNPGARSRILN